MADSKFIFAAGAIGGNLSVACDALNNADKIAFKVGERDLSEKIFATRNQIVALLSAVEALKDRP